MLEFGADMADGGVPGTPLFIVGTVRQLGGTPVADAVLDVWQADADGAYEAQLEVDEARLRGKYTSTSTGAYCVRTIAPLSYSIPMDGPVGELISRTDISHYRPAHVHFLVDVPRPRTARHPPVSEGCAIPGHRRRLRSEGPAGRRVRAPPTRAYPGRPRM